MYSMYMTKFRPVSRGDVTVKKSSIPGAGKGVFCKRDVCAGTTIPYFGIAKKTGNVTEGEDGYCMSVTYVNERGKVRALPGTVVDGDPEQEELAELPKRFRAASMVNEAAHSNPNAIFVPNCSLCKEDIVTAYNEKQPINIALLVVPRGLKEGEEVLTMYGSDYDRGYEVYDVDTEENNDDINEAHRIIESAKETIGECFNA